MDKLKDMASKASGGSSGGSSGTSSGTSSGGASGQEKYVNQGVDMATDKAGLGDKYDKQGGEFVNKQLNNQMNKK